MKKALFTLETGVWFALMITIMTGCGNNSHQQVSKSTLIMNVSVNGNHLKYVSHHIQKRPFDSYHSGNPLYEADMFSSDGHKLYTTFFGKIFFMGKGPVYQLTFPYYKNLHRITIYRLDSSSGHITNRDDRIALTWIYP